MSEFHQRVLFIKGDLTLIDADAIVCPSLPDLDVLKTGVAGAIFRRGGERIFAEAREIARTARKLNSESEYPVPLCSAHLTSGGNLPNAKHVIHSVAVSFSQKYGLGCNTETIFRSAWNVVDLATRHQLKTVAFPALGSGLYEVPVDESFRAIASATTRYLQENPETTLETIKLVALDPLVKTPSLITELVMDRLARSMRPSREPKTEQTFPINIRISKN